MNPPPKHITTCRICRQEFAASAFVPILNGGVDPRIQQFGTALSQHLLQKHSGELSAFLIVTCFNLSDPILVQLFEPLRWAVQQNTRRANATDEQLAERTAKLKLDADTEEHDRQEVLAMFRDLRDYLTEQGVYGLKPAQPDSPVSQLVTP